MKLPWEEEGATFDAERAKNLVLGLRDDKTKLQEKLETIQEQLAEALSSKESLEFALAEAKEEQAQLSEKYEQVTRELSEAELLRTKEKILADKGLPADLADLLIGEDEQALEATADRLVSLRPTPAAESAEPEVDNRPDPAQNSRPAAEPRQEWANEIFGS